MNDTIIYARAHHRILVELVRQRGVRLMAEVGVASGETSEILLTDCPGLRLWMVDTWTCPDDRKQHRRWNQGVYNRGMAHAAERTRFADDRRALVRNDSVKAARSSHVPSKLDLVFIDADHVYKSVAADCRAWWPKLKDGGIMCGHDIDSSKDVSGIWGVRRAVEEFSVNFGYEFYVDNHVWVMEKTKGDICMA